MTNLRFVWPLLRICMGWTFLWPFLDKVFGLGFSTESGKSWLDGVSPTTGFLTFGTQGPFSEVFQTLAGQGWVDWLFMVGLLLIGVSLLLGIGMHIATTSGAVLVILMWLAVLPPAHNPILDEHIVYAFVLIGLLQVDAGQTWGFGRAWSKSKLVKRYPFLR